MEKINEIMPQIHSTVYVAEGAIVRGKVSIGAESSVFFHATVRAQNAEILIGKQTNIQDNCVLHVDPGEMLEIGDGVTIGHSAVVHCRKVGDNSLIGMGAILLNGAVIGKNCIIGAGALVTKNTVVPDGTLVLGQPGKVVRVLTEEEIEANRRNALHYVKEAKEANSIDKEYDIIIRDDIGQYMSELKKWLQDTEEIRLEDMESFFTQRIDGYEEHMSVWKEAYARFAGLLPDQCVEILDIGCGTGLELDKIWERNPGLSVTGVDLNQKMLDELLKKHGDKKLKTVCADYFQYEIGDSRYDAVISFESLHHFTPEAKRQLYTKIYRGLKADGVFLLGDYIACCDEEEEFLRETCRRRRERDGIPEGRFVHFDTPLTLEHELELLADAGFGRAETVECVNGATIILVRKDAL